MLPSRNTSLKGSTMHVSLAALSRGLVAAVVSSIILLSSSDGQTVEASAPTRRATITLENTPGLAALGSSIVKLLETGNVQEFVSTLNPTAEDRAIGAPADAGPDRTAEAVARKAKSLTRNAEHLLSVARKLGLDPGRMRYALKTVTSSSRASRILSVDGREVRLPVLITAQVVLTGEPIGDASTNPALRGDYEFSISNSVEYPAGWRLDDGVRWVNFPKSIEAEAVRADLALANKVASGLRSSAQRGLSGPDDEALVTLGHTFVEMLQKRTYDVFVRAATLSTDETRALLARGASTPPEKAKEVSDKMSAGAEAGARALVDAVERLGVDLSKAKIAVNQVSVNRPSFTHFGETDGILGRPLRISLSIASEEMTPAGNPVAGDYVILLSQAMRTNGKWVLVDDKMRWEKFPDKLLSDKDRQALELENYVAQHRKLPPKTIAPDVEMTRLSDHTPVKLSSFRGKVVILEFWATWCGPCQEPMAKLQHALADHPNWKDRVEIIALSIDENAKLAIDHLEKKNWTSTTNLWAGKGGFRSPAPRDYRVSGIPTVYVIDRDGVILDAGHPMSLDVAGIVDKALK